MNVMGTVLMVLVLGSGCAKPDWIERIKTGTDSQPPRQ
jgi:hypothetical protein